MSRAIDRKITLEVRTGSDGLWEIFAEFEYGEITDSLDRLSTEILRDPLHQFRWTSADPYAVADMLRQMTSKPSDLNY